MEPGDFDRVMITKRELQPVRIRGAVCFGWVGLGGVWSLLFSVLAFSAPWPGFRGPDRDGHTTEILPSVLTSNLTALWRKPVGHGYAGVVVVGTNLVVLEEVDGKETARCLDPVSGKDRWAVAYAEGYSDEYEPGPRCTPLMDGDRIYVQSCRGEFRCLNLADGKTRWRFHFEDFGAFWTPDRQSNVGAANRRGHSGSAAIVGDRILVQVGSTNGASVMAFDKFTGRTLWKSQDDLTCYSSLAVGRMGGRTQAVAATCEGLMAVAADDGSLLWRVLFRTGANRNCLTPIIEDDTVTFASHTTGMQRLRIEASGSALKPVSLWMNTQLKLNLSTPVAVGSHYFGLGSAKDFICVERETGKIRWSQPGFGAVASVITDDHQLLVLNDRGELLLMAVNPNQYVETGRIQACGKTFSSPAFSEGVAFVRDSRELSAWKLIP